MKPAFTVRRAVWVASATLAGVAAGFAMRPDAGAPPDLPSPTRIGSVSGVRAPQPADRALVRPRGGSAPAGAFAAVERLWTDGSLRGSTLDGDWGVWTGDSLQPGRGLRRRFDQLLSTQGEADRDALRRWVEAQVAALHGAGGAAQVLDVWDRYVQVQSARYGAEIDPADPGTWQRALAEHSRIRREILGSAWAEAFYGEEERDFAADAGRRLAPSTAAPPAADPDALLASASPAAGAGADRLQAARAAQFGVDAANRLQANDAAWAAWQLRVATARARWQALEAAPELSPVQRQDAQERLLTEQFAGNELARARGLLVPATVAK